MKLLRKLWRRWARKTITPTVEPHHTDPYRRNAYPGLAWDSPVRRLRTIEILARYQ